MTGGLGIRRCLTLVTLALLLPLQGAWGQALAAAPGGESLQALESALESAALGRDDFFENRFAEAVEHLQPIFSWLSEHPELVESVPEHASRLFDALILRARAQGVVGDLEGAEASFRLAAQTFWWHEPDARSLPPSVLEQYQAARSQVERQAEAAEPTPDAAPVLDRVAGPGSATGPDAAPARDAAPLVRRQRLGWGLGLGIPAVASFTLAAVLRNLESDTVERLGQCADGLGLSCSGETLDDLRSEAQRRHRGEVSAWATGGALTVGALLGVLLSRGDAGVDDTVTLGVGGNGLWLRASW